MSSTAGQAGKSPPDEEARGLHMPHLTSLHARLAKKRQLERKSHHLLPDSTTGSPTNFHLPRPGIYRAKNGGVADPTATPRTDSAGVVAGPSSAGDDAGIGDGFCHLGPMIRRSESSASGVCVPANKGEKKTGLMDLPAELRCKVFRPLVVESFTIVVCDCRFCKTGAQPALSFVCRKLRADALSLFYRENRFRIRRNHIGGDEAPMWVRQIGMQNRSLIQHLEIDTFSILGARIVMEMYDFEVKHVLTEAGNIGQFQGTSNALRRIVFKGISLTDNEEHIKNLEEEDRFSLAGSIESLQMDGLEIRTAQEARVVRPHLRTLTPRIPAEEDETKP